MESQTTNKNDSQKVKDENINWVNLILGSAFNVSDMLESLLHITKDYWRAYDRAKIRNKPRQKKPGEGIGPYEPMPKRMRREAVDAMQLVIDAFKKKDVKVSYSEWQELAHRLEDLCYKHPDALRESGFTFDGAADQMALAACLEAARYGYYKSSGYFRNDDEKLWKVEGHLAKMLFYMFKAFSQAPAKYRASCLNWVARNINFNQYAHSALKQHKAFYKSD